MNSFAVLEGFSSDNPQEYKAPKVVQAPKAKKPKAKKPVAAPIEEKSNNFAKKNKVARARGHGLDRNRMQARKGKTFDKTKPGKMKKQGAGKGNWGKNDGKADKKKFVDKKATGAEEEVVEEKVEEKVEEAVVEEEVVEEVNNTVTYEEYLQKQSGSLAKRAKHKIDNSNLDANLQKKSTQTSNTGISAPKSGKRAKNKRRKKGLDLNTFLAETGPAKKSANKKTYNKGAKKANAPNITSLAAFPSL